MSARVSACFLRLMILGPPGSGKGTIGKRIAETFSLKHVSSGDALRDHMANSTAIGQQAKDYINNGKLVPDSLVTDLMLKELSDIKECGWLLDGFPRTLSQAESLTSHRSLHSVIYLDVPFETIINRVKDRWIHAGSGRVYNVSYNPPKRPGVDDITGEDLIQRDDDRPETVSKRLKNYQLQTTPLLEYYANVDLLTTFTGTQSDVIWPEVNKFIREHLNHQFGDNKKQS